MVANEDEGFQELFDRLLAYSSTKQSVRMSEIKRQNRRDDPMEVDALSKGKGQERLFWLWKGERSKQHVECCVLELWQVWPQRERL